MRSEQKFGPHDYPPLGYTGAATPEDEALLRSEINGFIDAVLDRPDGPIQSEFVAGLMPPVFEHIDLLETEDRERAGDYMIEVWYLLGFHTSTGHFEYGSYFKRPEGYGEPLPPGWAAPDKPRPIGRPGA